MHKDTFAKRYIFAQENSFERRVTLSRGVTLHKESTLYERSFLQKSKKKKINKIKLEKQKLPTEAKG